MGEFQIATIFMVKPLVIVAKVEVKIYSIKIKDVIIHIDNDDRQEIWQDMS